MQGSLVVCREACVLRRFFFPLYVGFPEQETISALVNSGPESPNMGTT